MEDDTLSCAQAAARLGVSRETVRLLCERGKLACIDAGTADKRHWRIPRANFPWSRARGHAGAMRAEDV